MSEEAHFGRNYLTCPYCDGMTLTWELYCLRCKKQLQLTDGSENERLRSALTRFAERGNWQPGEPDAFGGTNYEWVGDDYEPFEMAAAELHDDFKLDLRDGIV